MSAQPVGMEAIEKSFQEALNKRADAAMNQNSGLRKLYYDNADKAKNEALPPIRSAIEAGGTWAPKGWKLVPIEPTADMLAMADEAMVDTVETDNWLRHARNAWDAMLAAAPHFEAAGGTQVAQDTGEAARAVLRKLEWSDWSCFPNDARQHPMCPSCERFRDFQGHSPTCELARALAESTNK